MGARRLSAQGPGTALLLVDLQNDYLARPGLVPEPEALCRRASSLLQTFRELGLPVAHAHTVTRADGSDRMPHWKRLGIQICVEGTPGAQPPVLLAPATGELVARKRYYSAFADPQLDAWLRERDVGRLVLGGVYLHACVRSTVLDAYERGYEVRVADDAVGTTEPLHGELTRSYLSGRAARFGSTAEVLAWLEPGTAEGHAAAADERQRLPVAVIAGTPRLADGHGRFLHRDPCRTTRILAEVPLGSAAETAAAAGAAQAAIGSWARSDPALRAELLESWAADLEAHRALFADQLVREVAKPRRFAEEEVGRAIAHVRVAAELARAPAVLEVAAGVSALSRPLGVVGLLTPWNNPLAIPVGKIAPALALGNAVVLKPAAQASETALALTASLERAGLPAGLVNSVLGAAEASRALCREPGIAAISVTGSVGNGRSIAALCAESLKPLQAELGGNNAAIVLADADLEQLVPELTRAAFGFAGQRCTAIRRMVVEESIASRFESLAAQAVRALVLGPPDDPATEVGPLISVEKRDQVVAALEQARSDGARLVSGGSLPQEWSAGAWLTPALLADVDPGSRVVQEETFGPLAVIQVARTLEEALALANGVSQGLLQSVHTGDGRARAQVLEAAQAGIVKLGSGPLAVHPRAPFSGWKTSGLGPPEHGIWDAAFYTRTQAVYDDAD